MIIKLELGGPASLLLIYFDLVAEGLDVNGARALNIGISKYIFQII